MRHEKLFTSSASEVNLRRTAAGSRFPERYHRLLKVVEAHYGVQKRPRELLMELNHPYVIGIMSSPSSRHFPFVTFTILPPTPDRLSALTTLLTIYLDMISPAIAEETRRGRCVILLIFSYRYRRERSMPAAQHVAFLAYYRVLPELSTRKTTDYTESSSYIKDV